MHRPWGHGPALIGTEGEGGGGPRRSSRYGNGNVQGPARSRYAEEDGAWSAPSELDM